MTNRCGSRGPGESNSDVILRLATHYPSTRGS
jgi:hypothetical protein